MSSEIEKYKSRREELIQEFNSWRDQFIELSDFITPKKGRFLYSRDSKANDGKKRFNKIIDNHPGRSLKILSAGMQSGLTSPARDWFRITLPDRDLAKFGPVKAYLDEATKRMKFIFQASNFYNVTHSTYTELGGFGTGAMMITKNPKQNGIRCYPFTIGEYTFDTDHLLRVDTFYRTYKMTTRNIVNEFGKENVSDSIAKDFESGKLNGYHDVVHLIQPNADAKQESILSIHNAWVEVYFELAGTESKFLRKSGYEEFPIMGPRWDVTGSDVYGISPGMEALGDVKQLMKMKEKTLIAMDKWVDPPLNSPSSLKNEGVNILPGGVNYTDALQPGQAVTPVFAVRPELGPITAEIQEVKQAIREAFFNDLFLMISQSGGGQKTAEEIIRRHEEKLVMLGPVIERIQPEMLKPAIDRTFSLMEDMNLLPEPPRELLNSGQLDIEYIGPLAQAQRMAGVDGVQQLIRVVGEVAAVKPDVIDKIDFDETIDQISDMLGTPAGVVRPDKDVKLIRADRAQQAATAERQQQLMTMAEGAKTLADADMSGDNALNMVIDNLGLNQQGGPGGSS